MAPMFSLIPTVLFFGFLGAACGVGLEEPFPNIRISSPVDLQHDPTNSSLIYVIAKRGVIYVWNKELGEDAEATVFLDIQGRVTDGGERGLLGLAFHPDYETNRRFFVYYTGGDLYSVISSFEAYEANPLQANPDSEEVRLQFNQPNNNHNGGQVVFGPDGMLYIAVGDGGGGNDPDNGGQTRSSYWGNILRINVDGAEGYEVPDDNPFVDNEEGYLTEIWAYGFRNPWRISFDSETGRLWAGDVGQGYKEEIDVVDKGGNYGWKIMEGDECRGGGSACDQTGLLLPVHVYRRSEGRSITGGYVYRGDTVEELFGKYVFADFETRNIWALSYSEANPFDSASEVLFSESEWAVSSFGEDSDKELYLLIYNQDRIFRFNSTGLPEMSPAETIHGPTVFGFLAALAWYLF